MTSDEEMSRIQPKNQIGRLGLYHNKNAETSRHRIHRSRMDVRDKLLQSINWNLRSTQGFLNVISIIRDESH